MDYDVAALSLATPPASAPVQSYRPAVSVRNLGIHDADVTGTLSIYDRAAGTLIVTMNLAANSIAPGETRNAVADKLWTPTNADIGRAFLFMAVIVYPPDQYLPNNNLQPVTVIVTTAPPTPPPPVEAHADQHEDGGGDEVTVQGLSGKLAEAQTPTEHASNHEDGGADQLDVAGLVGELATPQTPKVHATSHQIGGADPVTGIKPGAHATSHEPGGDDEITGIGTQPHHATHEPGGTDEIAITYPLHQASHEIGGMDVLSVNGLTGVLSEQQTPSPHASRHQPAGDDPITIVYPQHNVTHEAGGGDALNVAGLQGILSQAQFPQVHGDSQHGVEYERQSNKGTGQGYAPLDDNALVPVDNLPGLPPTNHGTNHESGGVDEVDLEGMSGLTATPQTPILHGSDYHALDVERTSAKGAGNGYCPLDAAALVPLIHIPPLVAPCASLLWALDSQTIPVLLLNGIWVTLLTSQIPPALPARAFAQASVQVHLQNPTVLDHIVLELRVLIEGFYGGTVEQRLQPNSPEMVQPMSAACLLDGPVSPISHITIEARIWNLTQGLAEALITSGSLIGYPQ